MGSYVLSIAGASLTASECLASRSADVSIAWDGGRFGIYLPYKLKVSDSNQGITLKFVYLRGVR